MKKSHRILMYFLLSLLIVLSVIYIVNFFSLKKEAAEESNLLNAMEIYENEIAYDNKVAEETNVETSKEVVEEKTNEVDGNLNEEKTEETERMAKLKKLQEENADIVGWLEIENTSINYPVLQGTDNEYYMTHNYKKEKSKNGSIFLTKDYDWTIPSSNLLMYGHNLGNGTMFQELLKYEDKNFYKQHQTIRFTTTEEDAKYEIISVFKSRVYYKSEKNVFRYYYFVNAETEEEYNEFVENAKKASLYDIDATAKYDEQLITLSTCSYHVEDGRFAVVGKKVEINRKALKLVQIVTAVTIHSIKNLKLCDIYYILRYPNTLHTVNKSILPKSSLIY